MRKKKLANLEKGCMFPCGCEGGNNIWAVKALCKFLEYKRTVEVATFYVYLNKINQSTQVEAVTWICNFMVSLKHKT